MPIVIDLYINKSNQRAKFLAEHPIQLNLKRKLPTSKPKPRGQPSKALPKTVITQAQTTNYKPTDTSPADQPANVKTATTLSVTEINSIIYKSADYKKAVSDPIHRQ